MVYLRTCIKCYITYSVNLPDKKIKLIIYNIEDTHSVTWFQYLNHLK